MLDQIDIISGQLRDAVFDAEAWTPALDTINTFADGTGAVLLSVEERLRHAPMSSGIEEMIRDYFDNDWYTNDSRDACVPLLRHKGIVRDHDVLDMERSDQFHSEFLARHNQKWFAGVAGNRHGDMWCLALQRSRAKGPFLDADMPRLELLRERLEEVAAVARLTSRQWLDGAVSAFETDDVAALILDRTGRILHMSAAARSIVLGPNAARPRSSTPAMSSKAFEARLRSTFRVAPASRRFSTRMPIEHDGKAYVLEVTSLLGQASLVFSKASILVRIQSPAPDPQMLLESRYRLTPSEARVAMALAAGLDVAAMSERFKVSPHTIRVQLKMAFAKTETGSQAKLVSFIARLGKH